MSVKLVYLIMLISLLTIIAIDAPNRLALVKGSPGTVLAVTTASKLSTVNTFHVNITVADVQSLWGFQFFLSYDTDVLTASDYSLYLPFWQRLTCEINDAEGYIFIANWLNEPTGLTTAAAEPIVRIDFFIDNTGFSILDLHDSKLSDPYGNAIPHTEVGSRFSSYPVFYNFVLTVTPEFPTISDEVYVKVSFDLDCRNEVETFGSLSQSGDQFSAEIEIYVPEMLWTETRHVDYTYNLGMLPEGSYSFVATVLTWGYSSGLEYYTKPFDIAPPAVAEFPLGHILEVAFIPLVIYVYLRNKRKSIQ